MTTPVPPLDLVIRPARASEQGALEALQWRASLENPGDRDALHANPDAVALPMEQILAGQVHVAERDGSIVGFAAVLPREEGGSDLDALFVEPGMWRQGIGRRLVDHCVAVAQGAGSEVLHVIGNPHAEGFYTSCGFQVSGRTATRFGVGLSMRRTLGRE